MLRAGMLVLAGLLCLSLWAVRTQGAHHDPRPAPRPAPITSEQREQAYQEAGRAACQRAGHPAEVRIVSTPEHAGGVYFC